MKLEHRKNNIEWLVKSGLSDANFWETLIDSKVKCNLCPRDCTILPGNFGFCKSRYNQNGVLKTAIWGKMLTPSVEPIETEAVFHYWPGAKILSLGNLGCNLECDFCQNWESSDMRNLSEEFIRYFTPTEIVDLAKKMDIKIISFTYNDPIIWFEYVYETAKLAHQSGIKTLFKSAGFISPQAAKYLTKVIDIFSISLKSIDEETFKSMSKGNVNDVLEAIKIFYKSNKHLEISNLVIPKLTDAESDIKKLVKWIKKELSTEIPLHFVRFHPAYRYTDVERTSIELLVKAREIALEQGMKYVYIGNTYEKNHADVYCRECGQILINRFGLYTEISELSPESCCLQCGENQKIVLSPKNGKQVKFNENEITGNSWTWEWTNDDSRNLHVEVKNLSNEKGALICDHLKKNGDVLEREITSIPGRAEIRMAIGQKNNEDKKVIILSSDKLHCNIVELLDRAHFPLKETAKDNMAL
ncbi:MAG: AmmeMemoRadiSam system radical SAM enzyme [Desulfobacteraceae bacterium]|nr:AmmeMemoRadiSam system radical SAM enzyme [Desulfobacteraceae bacterium]